MRANRSWSALMLAVVVAASAGCHTLHFNVHPERTTEVVRHRKSYFLWGLVPATRTIDVREFCPEGVSGIREQTSFVDGLITLPLLGLWELRSSWYYCVRTDVEETG